MLILGLLLAAVPPPLTAQFPPRAAYHHPFTINASHAPNTDLGMVEMLGWWEDPPSGSSLGLSASYQGSSPPVDTYGIPIALTLQVTSVRDSGYAQAHVNNPYFIGNPDTVMTLIADGSYPIALSPTRWYVTGEQIPGDPAHETVHEVYVYSIGMEEWLRVVNAARIDIGKGAIHGAVTDRPHFDALKDFTSRLRRTP